MLITVGEIEPGAVQDRARDDCTQWVMTDFGGSSADMPEALGRTLLAQLRRRPWLGACVILISLGLHLVTGDRFPYLLFWAGVLTLAGGLVMGLGGELGYRRQQADRQSRGSGQR